MDNVFIKKNELSEWTQKYFKEELVSVDDLIRVIEDLDNEIEDVKEKYKDYKQMVADNYKLVGSYEMYGVSENECH